MKIYDGIYPSQPIWTMAWFWIFVFELLVVIIETVFISWFIDRKYHLEHSQFFDLFIAILLANFLTFCLGALFQVFVK